jgi:hypothetical protein
MSITEGYGIDASIGAQSMLSLPAPSTDETW